MAKKKAKIVKKPKGPKSVSYLILRSFIYLLLFIAGLTALLTAISINLEIKNHTHLHKLPLIWIEIGLVVSIINLVLLIYLLRWKKWAFWGYAITNFFSVYVTYQLGTPFKNAILTLAPLLILFILFQFGGKRKRAWNLLR